MAAGLPHEPAPPRLVGQQADLASTAHRALQPPGLAEVCTWKLDLVYGTGSLRSRQVSLGAVAVFLHDPVSTPDDVLRLLRDRVPEGLHLDYKAAWSGSKPDRQEEAGKDVAAFANAEGGDIIVGIEDGPPGLPLGFSRRPSLLEASQVRAWLNNVVVPRDVIAGVRIRPITVNDGTGEHEVLVVSVPPWPDGIVGVRTTKAGNQAKGRTMNDRISFLFPFRDEDESRFREFDEVLMTLNTTNRRGYLRLREVLRDNPTPACRIASPVEVLLEDDRRRLTLGEHAEVASLDPDLLTLKMTCTHNGLAQTMALGQARWIMQARSGNIGRAAPDREAVNLANEIDDEEIESLLKELLNALPHLAGDCFLAVPVSQVEDAWMSQGVMHLLLRVGVLLTESGWAVNR